MERRLERHIPAQRPETRGKIGAWKQGFKELAAREEAVRTALRGPSLGPRIPHLVPTGCYSALKLQPSILETNMGYE